MTTLHNTSNAILVWGTKITVRIVLAVNDVSALEAPPPLYFQVSRQGFLPQLIPRIRPLWHHALPPGASNHMPWFSFNSLPLKWDVPVGVLYDLLLPNHSPLQPWPLVLHFTAFPTATLAEFTGEDSLLKSLLNSLKEASFITTGSADRVKHMVQQAERDLMHAITHADVGQYMKILHSLSLRTPVPYNGQVPARIYIRQYSTAVDGCSYLSSYEGIYRTSRPLPAGMTLQHALTPLLIQWIATQYPNNSNNNNADNDDDDNSNRNVWETYVGLVSVGGVTPSGTDVDQSLERKENSESKDTVSPPPPPPAVLLADIHKDLHSPDFFLYIVLHIKADQHKYDQDNNLTNNKV